MFSPNLEKYGENVHQNKPEYGLLLRSKNDDGLSVLRHRVIYYLFYLQKKYSLFCCYLTHFLPMVP